MDSREKQELKERVQRVVNEQYTKKIKGYELSHSHYDLDAAFIFSPSDLSHFNHSANKSNIL